METRDTMTFFKGFLSVNYIHFLTAIIGGAIVVISCLSQYGVNAPTVIFCTQWGLVCSTWFIATLPGMNNVMRSISWSLFTVMALLLGRQIPYMLNSPRIGESFYSFMLVMSVFLIALIAIAYLRADKDAS